MSPFEGGPVDAAQPAGEAPCRCIAAGKGGVHWPSDHKPTVAGTSGVLSPDESAMLCICTDLEAVADNLTNEAIARLCGDTLTVVERILAARDAATWEPGRWWRVLAADGSLWCETSAEDEARDSMRPGDRLQRQYVTSASKWVDQ